MRPPPVATADLLADRVAAATQPTPDYPRWVIVCATIGASLVSYGCSAQCQGPSCESSYPQGRVDLVGDLPFDGRSVTIDAVAQGAIVGSVVSGSDFYAAALSEKVFVGQPEVRSVRSFSPPTGEVTADDTIHLWQSDADGFGTDVAVAETPEGHLMAVGAPGQDRGRGEVHIFLKAHDGPADPDLIIRGDTQGDRFGAGVHACPDQTGDGVSELIVTSPWIRAPDGSGHDIPALAGAVFWIPSEALLEQTGTVLASEIGTFWWGEATGDSAGLGIDCSTDIDGDGLIDLLIGAPQAQSHAGAVYFISGSTPPTSGLQDAAFATIDGEEGSTLGRSIASTLRGGVPFLLIGADGFEAGKGSALLINAATRQGVARFESDVSTPDHLGHTVAVADLNGDGIDELLVGGPDRRNGQLFDIGQVLVFDGTNSYIGLIGSGTAQQQITDDQGFRRVGEHIVVTDFDGDGSEELLLPTRSPRAR